MHQLMTQHANFRKCTKLKNVTLNFQSNRSELKFRFKNGQEEAIALYRYIFLCAYHHVIHARGNHCYFIQRCCSTKKKVYANSIKQNGIFTEWFYYINNIFHKHAYSQFYFVAYYRRQLNVVSFFTFFSLN